MEEYGYEDCLDDTLALIKRYNVSRSKHQWNKWEFQDIRDELSEALVYFGPYYADLRADAEQAEVDRKLAYEERKMYWKAHYEGKRGTASLIESEALLDIREDMSREVSAKREYYKARSLVDRIDQVLNSIASRLKLLEKHDREL